MKKLYFLLLLVTGIVNAQIVTIPDANFKARLIALGVDTNSDGNIQVSEALVPTGLDLTNQNIADMTGIEAFTNIAQLFCSGNIFENLNVTANTALFRLECGNGALINLNFSGLTGLNDVYLGVNPLASINFTGCTALKSLVITDSQLTSIDVSGLPALTTLELFQAPLLTSLTAHNLSDLQSITLGNGATNIQHFSVTNCPLFVNVPQFLFGTGNLQTFNVSNCTGITTIDVGSNPLTTLNVSGCTGLTNLSCSNNQLTVLDLSTNINLVNLSCAASQFTTLNLAANIKLNSLDCRHNYNMTSLLMKNGKNETFIDFSDNPALAFICGDEGQISTIQNLLNTNAMTNVVTSSYCSFTPGGNYNQISGNVRFDIDGNGCTGTDIVPTNVRMGVTDGTLSGATYVNANAGYLLYTGIGNLTLTPSHEIPEYYNFTPASSSHNLPLLDGTEIVQNFCMTANGNHPDAEIALVPLTGARPGFNAEYQLVYKNKGNQPLSGTINLTFDDDHTDLISATPSPDNTTTDSLIWNYSNLMPFETRIIYITLNLNSPQENPALNSGDNLAFTANINFISGDLTPGDNIFNLLQPVVNSYDPNDKTCLEGANVISGHIGKYLHYNINFENTGTESAINIVVRDVIDTTKFDINSLQLLYASHVVYPKITGNVVEFIFENIMLPIGGHGNVLFKIKTLPTLTVGDQVTNTANIYFDYNFPIVTNEARTLFTQLSKADFVKDNSVTIYPNPATNKISIKADNAIQSIELFDIQGRILETVLENKNATSIDISAKQHGIYFLKINTEKGSKVEKMIKE